MGEIKNTLSAHKKRAWDTFSIFIRTRDCLRTTGTVDEGTCVTCDRLYPFKKLQAGHWIPGRNNAVLFSERGVHAQCVGCNGNPPYGKKGNPIKYWLFMENHYGREVMDELIAESKTTLPIKKYEYDDIYDKYVNKIKGLRTGKILAKLDSNLPF